MQIFVSPYFLESMKKSILYNLVFALIVFGFISCSESLTDNQIPNSAPDTFIFLFPDNDISQQPSRLQVHWWGDDPDGLIVGFYFKWDGLDDHWTFTSKNDSLFSLPIGTADTTFSFLVSAADNGGNGIYDNSVMQNGIDYGPEPFIDMNDNGVYDNGEQFYDIGLIDLTPAERLFPIKNSPPIVEWNEASSLPLVSFPVITVGWNATDTDGDESITEIEIALNDTSNFVALGGSTRLVTLRIQDLAAASPQMEILLNADENNINPELLGGLKLDDNNRIILRAKDISGGVSKQIVLPDTSRDWFVKKPRGKLLIIDDYEGGAEAANFYITSFNSLNGGVLVDKYDVFDLENNLLPYPNISFLETLKLFDYIYWYSDASPNLTFANLVTQKFINNGGKIFFSMTFEETSGDFAFDLATLQNFLPIDSLGQDQAVPFLLRGASILPSNSGSGYPQLETTSTVGFVRTFVPSVTAVEVYDLASQQINGNISFIDNSKSLFFIGIPLNNADGISGNVLKLLEKVLFEEFGLNL